MKKLNYRKHLLPVALAIIGIIVLYKFMLLPPLYYFYFKQKSRMGFTITPTELLKPDPKLKTGHLVDCGIYFKIYIPDDYKLASVSSSEGPLEACILQALNKKEKTIFISYNNGPDAALEVAKSFLHTAIASGKTSQFVNETLMDINKSSNKYDQYIAILNSVQREKIFLNQDELVYRNLLIPIFSLGFATNKKILSQRIGENAVLQIKESEFLVFTNEYILTFVSHGLSKEERSSYLKNILDKKSIIFNQEAYLKSEAE